MAKKPTYEELEKKVKEFQREASELEWMGKALKRSEQEKANILNSMTEHVVYQDILHKVVWANKAAGESVNLPPQQLVGRYCYEIWQQRSKPCVGCPIERVFETGQPQEAEMTTPDGRSWFIRGNPIRDANGNITGGVEATLEITENKRAAEALRESEEKYRLLADNVTDNIWVIDLSTLRVTYTSPSVKNILGYTDNEVMNRPIQDFLTSQSFKSMMDVLKEEMARERSRKTDPSRSRTLEVEQYRKDGSTVWTEVTASFLRDANDKAIAVIGVTRDITARKQAQDKLTASLKEKEVLLKEVHHRVKNNMQVISSMLSLQSQHIKDKESLTMFQESQNRIRAMALIHEKLYTSEDLAHIDIAGYIHSLTHQLITTYRTIASRVTMDIAITDIFLTITTAIPCGLIINELVTNALKHAFPHQQKGTITVSMTPSTNDHLILTVSDTGIGFPKEIDFRNTTTLGMQLVTSLVEQLEGTITLDRSEGTRFRIKFRTQE